jgi:hypothetical protein
MVTSHSSPAECLTSIMVVKLAARVEYSSSQNYYMGDFVRRLWQTAQGMSQYRDKTTFIITADHGRGTAPEGWRDHGEKVEGAEADLTEHAVRRRTRRV